jgi:hypothetical protein
MARSPDPARLDAQSVRHHFERAAATYDSAAVRIARSASGWPSGSVYQLQPAEFSMRAGTGKRWTSCAGPRRSSV